VPGGSGGGIPGNGGCTGLAFWRFFSGRGLAKCQLNHLARWILFRSASARLNSTRTIFWRVGQAAWLALHAGRGYR
jgi:hypothetical protein